MPVRPMRVAPLGTTPARARSTATALAELAELAALAELAELANAFA